MKLRKDIDRETFKERFNSNGDCLEHLAELKWSDGYECRYCGHSDYIRGKQRFSRRCRQCGYDESATSHTIFHRLKFGIAKAFEMLYEITIGKKGASSIWLGEHFGVSQNTAWLFRQKVMRVMESSGKHPLGGDVHVDEFEIGTPQKGEQGRSRSNAKKIYTARNSAKTGKN